MHWDTHNGTSLEIGWSLCAGGACWWARWNILELFGSCLSNEGALLKRGFIQWGPAGGLLEFLGRGAWDSVSSIFFHSPGGNPQIYLKCQLVWFLQVHPIFKGWPILFRCFQNLQSWVRPVCWPLVDLGRWAARQSHGFLCVGKGFLVTVRPCGFGCSAGYSFTALNAQHRPLEGLLKHRHCRAYLEFLIQQTWEGREYLHFS